MNMRVDQDLKIELDRIATTQHRTTTNLVEWLIKQYLEQIAKRSAPKPNEDDAWDRQIAADAEAGKLDFLLDAAQNEYDAGKLHFR
ncbi:MAG: hypothetical protein BWK73_04545 [Thiothrix lacustris]|uniref:CopG-like ribbon-helix-helix domain-containing protein n=1 Tax=Thiothrix lacustris TaxID=525917 RepID=A0A1Y1QYI4_9GAMM|nr:MAG: hypothetical protein BWK73_04545 [Thiothrix lacustris]